jgi:hypothetical protein
VLLTLQNLLLAVFNLLPAFPLDGGRLLRSFLAALMPFRRATRAASYVGQGLAVALVGVSFLPPRNFFLTLIGAFVFLAAWQERSQVMTQDRLSRYRVRDAMQPLGKELLPTQAAVDAAREIAASPQTIFPVRFDDGSLRIITRDGLLKAAKKAGATVGARAEREVVRLSPDMGLEEAQARFGLDGAALVVEHDEVIAVLGREDIARLDAALEVLGS